MATVAGVKIKLKKFAVRNPLFADEKYTGTEPVWDTEAARDWEDSKFDNLLRQSFYYYNYYYNQKDCKKHVVAWMKTAPDFTPIEVKQFMASSDRSIPMTACGLIMAHKAGMPFRGRHIAFITECILKAIDTTPEAEVQEVKTSAPVESYSYKPTIQDRLSEKTSEIIGELEGVYDEVHLNNKITFKPYDFLMTNNVVQSQLGKYEALYTKRKAELEEAMAKVDAQLVEGYKMYKSADFKRMVNWINDLLAAIDQYRGVKKATKKARVKKAPSKEKVISKLKYAKTNTELKIVSINPADIVGAQALWIYNAKTRKIGKYVAAAHQTLGVKGTTLTGFDTDTSVAKTLRKPADQLKAFAKAGKVVLRTFLADIKATETKLNGRISADILLIKVE